MNITHSYLRKAAAAATGATFLMAMFFGASEAHAAAPSAPVISTVTQSTSTNPIILTGTADANMSIQVTGGVSTTTASTSPSGTWSVAVNLTPNVLNQLAVVSFNTGGEFSGTTTVNITHDNMAPTAPVVTFPTTPHSTTTSPIAVFGTAEASSTITISGGNGTTTATTTGSGNWSAMVSLNSSSTNMLSVTATDVSGNVSGATALSITHSVPATTTVATSSPIITLGGASTTTVFSCNGFTDPGATAVNSFGSTTGVTVTASSTVNIGQAGTYTILYTATDDQGHTATTTRTVIVLACSSGGGGGGSSGGSTQVPPGLLNAVQNASPNSNVSAVLAGQIETRGLRATGEVQGLAIGRFLRELRQGSRGQDVADLQVKLASTGLYKGPITGYFGTLTARAVRALQRGLGLQVTGRLDANTINLLNNS